MGESTCLMHAFSCPPPPLSNDSKQESPMLALGESVSFGRFMPESLDWEKWSIFSHKRYVEEAERYAQPGSVAQKKAFFEAHYKRKAAMKAAEMLEQANVTDVSVPELGGGAELSLNSSLVLPPTVWHGTDFVDEEEKIKNHDAKKEVGADLDRCDSDTKPVELVVNKVGGDYPVNENDEAPVQNPASDQSLEQVKNAKLEARKMEEADPMAKNKGLDKYPLTDEDKLENPTRTTLTGKTLLKQDFTPSQDSSINKKKPIDQAEASKLASLPTKSIHPMHHNRENNAISVNMKPILNDSADGGKKSTPRKSLESLIYSLSKKESIESAIPSMLQATESEVPIHIPAEPRQGNISHQFLGTSHSRLQPSSLISPNSNEGERVVKRKQKHEENFSSKKTQKLNLKAKKKTKGKTGLKNLFQCFCFKTQPVAGFPGERETSNNPTRKLDTTLRQD